MKKLIIFVLLLVSNFVLAETLQNNFKLVDKNSLEHGEGGAFLIDNNNSAGYFSYHSIWDVLKDNQYLYYSNIKGGVIDAGLYKNHNDFHTQISQIPHYAGYVFQEDSHGTGVTSVSFGSKMNNNLGTHGVVNIDMDYTDALKDSLSGYETLFNNYPSIKIITQSITLEYCTSYRAQNAANYTGTNTKALARKNYAVNTCGLTEGDIYGETAKIKHVKTLNPVRQHFIDNPDTLFLLSAGNESVDASWMNGAVHYRYVAAEGGNPETVVFDELDNLLVVAAVGYDGVLHDYSDYGESVDLAVISGVLAASCVDENGSYYYTDNTEDGYGIYRMSSDLGNSGAPCDSTGYGNGNNAFNGTSAAAPIAAGMSALLMNMDIAMTPARVKTLLTQYSSKASSRYTGVCDENDICTTQSLTETSKDEIAIPNLNNAYTQEKAVLMIQARNDGLKLDDLTTAVSNTAECMAIWNEGGSERKVHTEYKSYEAKFYGDRCLYFRGNSYVIDFDLETRQAEYIYYTSDNSNKYQEYMTFRHFVNNMKSAKTDETWRNGYGVTLNSEGNVGCTIADNCINGEITTVQQCTNMFEALTGVLPSVMNSDVYYNSINQHNRKENKCYFWNQNIDKYIVYNLKTGLVEVNIPQTGFSLSNGVVLNSLPDGINQKEIVIDITDLSVSGFYMIRMFVNDVSANYLGINHEVFVDHKGNSVNNFVNDISGYTIDKSKLTTVRIQVPGHAYTDQDEIRIQFTQNYGAGGL